MEEHIVQLERAWLADEYVNYQPSPPESNNDENEATLVQSLDNSQNTLTDDSFVDCISEPIAEEIEGTRLNESGFVDDGTDDTARVEENYSLEMKLVLGIEKK